MELVIACSQATSSARLGPAGSGQRKTSTANPTQPNRKSQQNTFRNSPPKSRRGKKTIRRDSVLFFPCFLSVFDLGRRAKSPEGAIRRDEVHVRRETRRKLAYLEGDVGEAEHQACTAGQGVRA